MRIEITNAETEELLSVIRQFTIGKIVVEDNKAYWEFDPKNQPAPRVTQVVSPQPQLTQPAGPVHNPVKNMRDYLFESFSV